MAFTESDIETLRGDVCFHIGIQILQSSEKGILESEKRLRQVTNLE